MLGGGSDLGLGILLDVTCYGGYYCVLLFVRVLSLGCLFSSPLLWGLLLLLFVYFSILNLECLFDLTYYVGCCCCCLSLLTRVLS